MRLHPVIFILCSLFPVLATAQDTTLNPKKAQFTPSPSTDVVRYELRHFVNDGTTPVRVDDLGKPTPDGTNTITAAFTPFDNDFTKRYKASVVAISPSGEGASTLSNQYMFAEGVELTMSQKVKLTIVGYDSLGNQLPPADTLTVWYVEGSSSTNVLGTFEDVPNEKMSVYFIPTKTGIFKVFGGYSGVSSWTTVVVNQ